MKYKLTKLVYVFCALALVYFTACKKQQVINPPVVLVEPVTVDNISIYGDYVGSIRALQNVEVHARVDGYIEKMTFNEGKKVVKGEPLFYINNAQYKAKLERAKAKLERDLAQEAKAKNDLERIKPLFELNAASRLDLDNAVAAYNISKADVAMSKADLAQAQLEYDYTIVRSPITGYMTERLADIGALVGSKNSLLARVVKRDTVTVDFKLTALDYLWSQKRNVHLGDVDSTRWWQPTVKVTLADNSVYDEVGIVDFASPQVDPKTGTFGVRAELPNPNQELLPGQFTRVKLLLDILENVVAVPLKSVSIEKGGAFIYVVRPDSVAEKRFIELAQEQNNKVVVTRGLMKGEQIVVEGYQKLIHGEKVIPKTQAEVVLFDSKDN